MLKRCDAVLQNKILSQIQVDVMQYLFKDAARLSGFVQFHISLALLLLVCRFEAASFAGRALHCRCA